MTTNAEQRVIDTARTLIEGNPYNIVTSDGQAADLADALEALDEDVQPIAPPRTYLVHFSFQNNAGSGVGNTFITDLSGLPVTVDMVLYWQREAIPNKSSSLHNILVLGYTELEGR